MVNLPSHELDKLVLCRNFNSVLHLPIFKQVFLLQKHRTSEIIDWQSLIQYFKPILGINLLLLKFAKLSLHISDRLVNVRLGYTSPHPNILHELPQSCCLRLKMTLFNSVLIIIVRDHEEYWHLKVYLKFLLQCLFQLLSKPANIGSFYFLPSSAIISASAGLR